MAPNSKAQRVQFAHVLQNTRLNNAWNVLLDLKHGITSILKKVSTCGALLSSSIVNRTCELMSNGTIKASGGARNYIRLGLSYPNEQYENKAVYSLMVFAADFTVCIQFFFCK
uniref:Uncharacterized protein n=1 Tax=Oryza sativa subsp. japonica TaxID=39947 RepID=Q6L4K2_ORYSJ|nr:unknown protein [Oryza sativa Japonica Group]